MCLAIHHLFGFIDTVTRLSRARVMRTMPAADVDHAGFSMLFTVRPLLAAV